MSEDDPKVTLDDGEGQFMWEYTSEKIAPGESHYDVLRKMGRDGWEAWYIEKTETGWREIFFKRPKAQ